MCVYIVDVIERDVVVASLINEPFVELPAGEAVFQGGNGRAQEADGCEEDLHRCDQKRGDVQQVSRSGLPVAAGGLSGNRRHVGGGV